jgi:single-strand DNA-binding protein
MNTVVLIGRVVAPPELRYTPSGKAVASFTLAVDRRRGGGANQENKETDFIPIVAWERLGEICNEYLSKGKLVCIQGSLRTRTYEQDGQKRKAFEINASEMQMLSTGAGGDRAPSGERPQSATAQHAPAKQPVGAGNWGNDVGFSDDVGMDDIPF